MTLSDFRCSLLLLGIATRVVVADTLEPPTNLQKSRLMALLEQETRLATNTRLNADYVPGILTVLRGEELENRGFRTVWEALQLVPNFTVTIEPTGRKQLIVRGIGKTYASGNVKILLNGVAVNDPNLGLAEPVLNIPIEQVRRIEVIRGPGSAVHGEFAFAGVVNVITYKEGQHLFASRGSFNTTGGGALLSWSSHNTHWHASANIAASQSDGADSRAGADVLYQFPATQQQYSNAPGPANEDRRDFSAVVTAGYKGFSILGQWTQSAFGDHFGINEILPPDKERLVEHYRIRNIELRQQVAFSGSELHVRLGQLKTELEKNNLYAGPAAVILYATPGDAPIWVNLFDREYRTYGNIELTSKPSKQHTLMAGVGNSHTEVTDSYIGYNAVYDPATSSWQLTTNPVSYSPSIPQGTTRRILSATLQDEYRPYQQFTLTTGVRYDEYSDIGSSTTPRIASVWRASEHHILKAQYGRAFRPPTLYEVALGQDNLKPATIDTAELGYIFKGYRHEARLTLFHSHLEKLITFDPVAIKFTNAESARSQGMELEYAGRPVPALEIDSNLSVADTQDDRTGKPLAGAPSWQANFGISYHIEANTILAAQYYRVGPFEREAADPRGPADGYSTTDLTLTLRNLLSQGLTLRAGVKNVLDSEVNYPASLTDVGVGYPDDYPQPGRRWWLQASYEF